jgi:hypothetical protein
MGEGMKHVMLWVIFWALLSALALAQSTGINGGGPNGGGSGGGTPGGSSGQIQYNNNGVFGGLTNTQVAGNVAPSLGTYLPATPITTATITAAEAAACSAGGGTVLIPEGTYTMTGPLPMCNGVTYSGTGWQWNNGTFGSGGSIPAAIGGTVLLGNGTGVGDATFDAFAYNATDLHASPPSNATTWWATALQGGGISNLTLRNFATAIHVGDYYNAGWQSGVIRNVTSIGSNWGLWLENFQGMIVENVYSFSNTTGQVWTATSSNNLWNNGNSQFINIQTGRLATSGNPQLVHSFVLTARGAGGALNSMGMLNILSMSNTSTLTTQTATFNGTTSVSVTDLSKWTLNLPVYLTGTVSGAKNNYVYFVTSVSGTSGAGTVTLGTLQVDKYLNIHANDISPATATGTINTYGFPHLELSGVNGGVIQPGWIQQMDFEGAATPMILAQDIPSGFVLEGGYVSTSASSVTTVSFRSSSNMSFYGFGVGNTPITFDEDFSSNGNLVFGFRPSNYQGPAAGSTQGTGPSGISQLITDPSGRLQLNPSAQALFLVGQAPDIAVNKNGFLELPDLMLGYAAISVGDGSTLNFINTHTQHIVYTGSGGAGITLPFISANGEGVPFYLVNATANTETVSTSGAQKIFNSQLNGGNTATTFTIPPYGSAQLIASYNYGGTGTPGNYFWSRLNTGTLVTPAAPPATQFDCADFSNTGTAVTIGDDGNAAGTKGSCVISDTNGHPILNALGTAPAVTGTGCSLVAGSTDNTGSITATGVDTCTLAFGAAFTNAPHCSIGNLGATVLANLTGQPTTAHAIFATAAAGSFDYTCL